MSTKKDKAQILPFPCLTSGETKAVSVEDLQASGHFEGWSEEDITSLLETIKAFTEIVYAAWSKRAFATQITRTISLQPNNHKAA